MYIISTLVLIHYEIELGLFTYFVTFYDISKQNSDFFHLIHFISWYKKQSKVYELFPLLFIATHQLPSISLPTFSSAFGIHWI